MNFTFANPALLAGAALFAVPLIIHLLNRRRYTSIRWAAQEFLLQAYRKTRRRLTLESLLLLLIRCALIVLLAFALARPFVPSSNPLSIFTAAQRNVVMIVDVSYSMTRTGRGGDTALDRAKEQGRVLIDQLSAERGDRVSLLTLSAKPQLLLHDSVQLDLARDRLLRLPPEWQRADLLRAVDLVDELVLAPGTGHREVFVFTDLQRVTFDPGDPDDRGDRAAGATARASGRDTEALPAPALRRAASRDATITIVDVGDVAGARNLVVTDVSPDPRNVVKGAVVTFTASVKNYGATAQQAVTGTFVMNGRREQGRPVTFDVPARGIANVESATVVKDEGFTTVEFEIAEDELPADDRRFLSFPVRDLVETLIVDGTFDRGEELRATAELSAVLNPALDSESVGSPYHVKTIDDRRFNLGGEDLAEFDLIVLADVPRIDEKVAQELVEVVRAGAGLMIFLGEQVDARAWNERLYRDDGSGLLPAKLLEATGDAGPGRDPAYRPKLDDLSHPIVALFRDGDFKKSLKDIGVSRFFRTTIGENDAATARVLALDDASPDATLILEKPAGHGRVVLLPTSADESWIHWDPKSIILYLSLVHEIAAFLTLPDLTQFNLGVGDRLRATARSIPSSIAVVTPNTERIPLDSPAGERENGRYVLPPFDRTVDPGLYDLEMDFPVSSAAGASAGARKVVRYAVNLDTVESDPERLDARALALLYPNVALDVVERVEAAASEAATSREGELWKPLLIVILALLALEMLLACWFGRRSLGGRS